MMINHEIEIPNCMNSKNPRKKKAKEVKLTETQEQEGMTVKE